MPWTKFTPRYPAAVGDGGLLSRSHGLHDAGDYAGTRWLGWRLTWLRRLPRASAQLRATEERLQRGTRPAPAPPNIITWPRLQGLVHANNESNFCDDLIDCIVFKESTVRGGFNANALGVPFHYSNTMQQAKGLMQITQGAANTVNSNYPHAASGTALYQALSNPALNIFVGSEYIQILSDEYGGLSAGLTHYGPKGYANDVLKCVQQLQQGNFGAAEAAAHGH